MNTMGHSHTGPGQGRRAKRGIEMGEIWGRREEIEMTSNSFKKKLPLRKDGLRLLTCVVEVVMGDTRFKTPFSGQCRKIA